MGDQLENGYTRIANSLLEKMSRRDLPGNCWRVILFVLRESYGYQRKHTLPVGYREIGRRIGMSSSSVSLAINVLLEEGIIARTEAGGFMFKKQAFSVQPAGQATGQVSSQMDKSVQPAGQKVSSQMDNVSSPLDSPNETILKKDLKKGEKERKESFRPPTIEEVRAYCSERKNNVNPERWHAYYSSNGWRVGRNPMKNWKAAVITWESSRYDSQTSSSGHAAPVQGKYQNVGRNV